MEAVVGHEMRKKTFLVFLIIKASQVLDVTIRYPPYRNVKDANVICKT